MRKWATVRVGHVCTQIRGVSHPKAEATSAPSAACIPSLRAGNITDFGLSLEDLVYVPYARVRAEQHLQRGDILIATSSGSIDVIGKSAQVRDDYIATFGAFCKVIRPGPRIDSRYAGHYFRTDAYRQRVSTLAAGANINNLRNQDLDNLDIPLPPLDEQRRIAAILDHADLLHSKRRHALARVAGLTQSAFVEILGDPSTNQMRWPVVDIGSMLVSADYGTSKKAAQAGTYPVLRMNNITFEGAMDFSNLKYMELPEDKVERYTVRDGDILFNRTNSTELVGKTAVYRGEDVRMAYAGYLIRLRTSAENSPDYISYFLNSRHGKAVLRNMCKSIIGMANINAREVQSIPIPRPPAELQLRFANVVRKIQDVRSRHYKSLACFGTIFASLQSRAFAGEL